MQENDLKKMVDERIKKVVPEFLKTGAFTLRKLTDEPTDDLMVTPRGYVNMYGSIAGRPASSVVGQQYFDVELGYPIYKNQNTRWVSGTGSVVG